MEGVITGTPDPSILQGYHPELRKGMNTSEVKTRHRSKKNNYAINNRMQEPEVEYNLKGTK